MTTPLNPTKSRARKGLPQSAPAASAEPAPAAVPTVINTAHPFLAEILASVAAAGAHTRSWAHLRRSVFPGPTGWSQLKGWCADNGIECELCFGQSSKAADVQFHKRRPGANRLPT